MNRWTYATTILVLTLGLSCTERRGGASVEPAPTRESPSDHAESSSSGQNESQAAIDPVQSDVHEPAQPNTSAEGLRSEQPDRATDVSRREIDAFAQCHVDLMHLGSRIQRGLAKGEPEEILKAEYRNQAQEIFADSLIDENRYVEIAQLAEVDPTLRERLTNAIEQLVEG